MKIFSLSLLFLLLSSALYAQADTINAVNNKLMVSRLMEGASAYLVYTTDSITGITGNTDIWYRSVAFSKRNNIPVVNFGWKIYRHDSLYLDAYGICLKSNLKPLYAHRLLKGAVYAVNYTDTVLEAADTVAINKADAGRKVALNPPVFNWEWDMETLPLLPITKTGQRFMVAFLDPFDVKAAYYPHDVIEVDNLLLNKEAAVKCWVLRVSYDAGSYADFWISQKGHEVLKMKEYYKGKYRYKVRLY
jgi:hypothetical protein